MTLTRGFVSTDNRSGPAGFIFFEIPLLDELFRLKIELGFPRYKIGINRLKMQNMGLTMIFPIRF